jgi:hypothetical protein
LDFDEPAFFDLEDVEEAGSAPSSASSELDDLHGWPYFDDVELVETEASLPQVTQGPPWTFTSAELFRQLWRLARSEVIPQPHP